MLWAVADQVKETQDRRASKGRRGAGMRMIVREMIEIVPHNAEVIFCRLIVDIRIKHFE
jgi:hypothetical protein